MLGSGSKHTGIDDPWDNQYRADLLENAREYEKLNTIKGIVPPTGSSWQTQFLEWWVKRQRAQGAMTEKQIGRVLRWSNEQLNPETRSWKEEYGESWGNRHRDEGTLTEEQIRRALLQQPRISPGKLLCGGCCGRFRRSGGKSGGLYSGGEVSTRFLTEIFQVITEKSVRSLSQQKNLFFILK